MATRSMLPDSAPRPPRRRGFAAMDPELQRAIASAGGRAAHEHGTAHEFTPDEARRAGRKGGQASARRRGGGGGDDAIH
jgi:general stress protein YciG